MTEDHINSITALLGTLPTATAEGLKSILASHQGRPLVDVESLRGEFKALSNAMRG